MLVNSLFKEGTAMKFKFGIFIIAAAMVVLSFFGGNEDPSLTSSEIIMTKADATAYWNSISAD